nr:hypothetical protein [Geodermatophilaceae bacterium]
MRLSTRGQLRSVLAPLVLVAVLIGGCATSIPGTGTTSDGVRENVAPSDLEIVGSGEQDVDVLARNALADIQTFWTEQFPDVFGEDFTPLAGGIYSIDPAEFDPASYPEEIGCLDNPADVANNAFYCFPQPGGGGDNIVYDRTLLQSLAADYGRFIPALVMAHEFGHTVQGRVPP